MKTFSGIVVRFTNLSNHAQTAGGGRFFERKFCTRVSHSWLLQLVSCFHSRYGDLVVGFLYVFLS